MMNGFWHRMGNPIKYKTINYLRDLAHNFTESLSQLRLKVYPSLTFYLLEN